MTIRDAGIDPSPLACRFCGADRYSPECCDRPDPDLITVVICPGCGNISAPETAGQPCRAACATEAARDNAQTANAPVIWAGGTR